MNKFLSTFILLSSVLILTTSVALYLSTQAQLMMDDVSTPTRETLKDEEGKLKYSLGSCEDDNDCTPSGCSSQICSNDANIITTCVYANDISDKEIYKCGCVEKICSWYK